MDFSEKFTFSSQISWFLEIAKLKDFSVNHSMVSSTIYVPYLICEGPQQISNHVTRFSGICTKNGHSDCWRWKGKDNSLNIWRDVIFSESNLRKSYSHKWKSSNYHRRPFFIHTMVSSYCAGSSINHIVQKFEVFWPLHIKKT